MDPSSNWRVWRNRLGKAKGVAIVFRASDIGLELHSALSQEADRAALCQELCDKLNRAEGRYVDSSREDLAAKSE